MANGSYYENESKMDEMDDGDGEGAGDEDGVDATANILITEGRTRKI